MSAQSFSIADVADGRRGAASGVFVTVRSSARSAADSSRPNDFSN
jgi:hypothetical protein